MHKTHKSFQIFLVLSVFMALSALMLGNYLRNLRSLDDRASAHYRRNSRVAVLFDKTTHPNAVSLVLEYDPAKLSVRNVHKGNIWTKGIEIREDIDQSAGLVMYDVGQSFNGKHQSSGKVIAILELSRLKSGGLNSLKVHPSSRMTFEGERELTPINDTNISFKVIK